MATKEIAIKVTVQGKELVLTGKQAEEFKDVIVSLKEQLNQLGERSEKNAEIFDKLSGDLQTLEQAFVEVKDEAKNSGDSVEEGGDKAEGAGQKTKSYAAQIKDLRLQLIALGDRTDENADKYDNLTSQIRDLSEKQEDLQFGTKKLDDALSAIPGPIGQAASSFKMFDDGLKNAKSAVGGLTKQFPILKNAIAATGIGALVIIIGLLVAAIMKAFQSFKPLQDAVGKLGVLFDILGEMVQPLIDLIGQGLTVVLEGLAKTLAFVTGNLDEYNKKVADAQATADLEKNLKKQEEFLDANGYKYDEFTQRKIKANIEFTKKKLELDKDETKSEAEKMALLKQYRDKANFEIQQADADRAAKTEDDRKKELDKRQAAADKAREIEKDFQSRLKNLKDENTLLEIEDEKERGRKKLEIDLKNQLNEINQLKISEKKKQQLRDETNKQYQLQLKQFNLNIQKQEEQANKDLAKQTRDIKISMIEDEKQRLLAEAEARRDDAIDSIKQSEASEEAKQKAIKAIREKYEKDKANVDKTIAEKNKENVYKQIEFERESRRIGLENKLKEIDLSTKREVSKVEARRLVMEEQAKIDFEAEMQNLKKLLDSKEISQKDYDEREKQRKKEHELKLKEIEIQSINERQQARQKEIDSYVLLAQSVLDLVNVFKKEGEESKVLIKIQEALTLASQIATLVNNIQALSELGKAYGKQIGKASALPFPASIPAIVAVIGTFTSVLLTAKQLFGIGKNKAAEKPTGPASNSAESLGRNYSDGGLIGGRRHAQGGTLIEAEQGEAILTRGAVTMFAPMLSAMNQMGGGTSFSRNALMTSYDAPVVDKPAKSQEPMVFKTYVVSNELTTEAEKLARLKDLSTL